MVEKIKLSKVGLIKKGTPHPTKRDFKLDSAHPKEAGAHKAEKALLDNPRVVDTERIIIPRQHAVYAKRLPRITPKRPKLRR